MLDEKMGRGGVGGLNRREADPNQTGLVWNQKQVILKDKYSLKKYFKKQALWFRM